MNSRWFWSTWLTEYKLIWYGLILLFICSFALVWYNYEQGAASVIDWNTIQEQKILESTVHSFEVGPFQLSVPADNYVIMEYYNGGNIQVNMWMSLAFTFVLICSAIIILTVITMLDRFWYFVGMALFILFVVSLRLEVLTIFGQRNQIPTIIILSCYVVFSFYFQALNKSIVFVKRLITFLFLTLVTALVIYYYSAVEYPMLHLAVTGYSAGLILSVLFILMVAHEIPAAFVYIASQGNSKSLRHFSIISVIYIFNIIVTSLHELGVIEWKFIYINLYLLISISAILGLWGFRLRESLYENIFSFSPYGAYFFTALATICFITIAYLMGTANDPALRVIRNVIIFAHVGYGVIFLTYVFSNFILLLAQNLPVYKILYKSNRMPYFTFRLAGLIMTLGFVFYSNWHQYVYKSIAGFYNNIGDLYELLDRSAIAEAYYEQGRSYGFENNHANYALGKKKAAGFDLPGACNNYASANGSIPTPFSLINEGNIYLWENDFFESIKAYQRGLRKISKAGVISNNLGYVFGKIHNLDSAFYYINSAMEHKQTRATAEANFFAIAAIEYLPIKSDSVLKILDDPSIGALSNAMALATSQGLAFNTAVDVLKESRLNLHSATLLNNYIIRNVKTLDTTFIQKAFAITSDTLNADYREALRASLAMAYYHAGNVTRALQLLSELVYLSQSYQGKYNYIMGLWALEQNNPKLAATYFKYAVDADYKEGKLYYAIALSESGQEQEAGIAWDSVAKSRNEGELLMAAKMKDNLLKGLNETFLLDDPDKYQYCRYRLSIKDTLAFNRLIATFKDDNYKAKALLDMTERQFEWGNTIQAVQYFTQIGGLKLSDKKLFVDVQHMELRMLAERKELRTLAKQINKEVTFTSERKIEKLYYTALLNEAAHDTVNALRNYKILATYNPYFEQGIIAAAAYFRTHSKDDMAAYNILVEAVQVNNSSVKLLKAYAGEALRMGFPEYAGSAMQQVDALYQKL